MLKKRIIPCLDIKNGRTVKGINFENLRDAGDPIELAKRYVDERADELAFLDISATIEGRKTMIKLVSRIAEEINIPFTVGGGISSLSDVEALISAGADKISINSAAVKNPNLIGEIATEFGSQCLVVAIDTNCISDEWKVFTHGGTKETQYYTEDWSKEIEQRGGGEILLTSMNSDGTKNGFELALTKKISKQINIPVIASGGAGQPSDFKALFEQTEATGALAASIFHYRDLSIPTLKQYLSKQNIAIR